MSKTEGEQRGTTEIDELLDKFEHECFMLRVEASETRAKDEDVRKAYERIREESAQAIAATLGGGECEMVTSGTPCIGNTDKRCTSCGASNIGEYYDGQDHVATTPRFCPNCERKVKR